MDPAIYNELSTARKRKRNSRGIKRAYWHVRMRLKQMQIAKQYENQMSNR